MTQLREINQKERSPLFPFQIQPRLDHLQCEKEEITAFLEDGRKLTIPTTWFKRLRDATLAQLQNYQILPDFYHIHWPDLDEDISLQVFLTGLNSGCC